MHRFLHSIFWVFLLCSCSRYLAVTQIKADNILIQPTNSNIDSLSNLIVKPYRDSLAHEMSKFIGKTSQALVRGKPESKLTNLVADVVFEYSLSYCSSRNYDFKPDLTYINYGGIRASLPQGDIKISHIYELMPFDNELVFLKITGQNVIDMVNRIIARGGECVAGINVGIKNGRPGSLSLGGKPIDPKALYWLATNDYIAHGGDQMSMLTEPVKKLETNEKIRDILIQSLSDRYKKHGVIDAKEDGRIYDEQ